MITTVEGMIHTAAAESTTTKTPVGETVPNYTGAANGDRYSWLKAPRYKGEPMEVGPLARVLVAYKSGQAEDEEKMGPAEAALIGTPVLDPERPVEILRVVHSFDPCIACAVHVIHTRTDKVYEVIATH